MKEFCGKCGKEIVFEERLPRGYEKYVLSFFGIERYDTTTGELNKIKAYRCPESRWWNRHESGFTANYHTA